MSFLVLTRTVWILTAPLGEVERTEHKQRREKMNARERMNKWLKENDCRTWNEAGQECARQYLRRCHFRRYEEAKVWMTRMEFFIRMDREGKSFPS